MSNNDYNEFTDILGNKEQDAGLDSGQGGGFDGPPMVTYLSGKVELKKLGNAAIEYAGGFFLAPVYAHNDKITQYMPADADKAQYKEIDLADAGWTKDSFTNGDGKEVFGWLRPTLEASLIRARECWEILIEKGTERPDVLRFTKYDDAKAAAPAGKNPRSAIQVLAVLKGMEAMPVMLTFKGFAMKDFKANVIGQLQKNLTGPIGASIGGHINYRSVWCPIAPAKDANGAPKFQVVGTGANSTSICTPAYIGPMMPAGGWGDKDAHMKLINTVFVGRELNAAFNALYDEYNDWAAQWADLKGQRAGGAAAEAPAVAEEKSLVAVAQSNGL